MATKEYPKTAYNQVNRLRSRAKYDFQTVHEIVCSTNILHVSFVPDPESAYPVVLPMIGQMGSFTNPSDPNVNQPLDLYLHGSISSRVMNLSRETVARGDAGLPVCIAATKVDGYVLALTPFHHSYNFRSAVIYGHAEVVENLKEKMYALELITNKVVPGRWQNTRTPPNKTEMQSTHILRVRPFTGSAKLRWGGPNADRADLKNQEVVERYWSGVIPIWESFGQPISGPQNQAAVPKHVIDFIESTNEANKITAVEAAQEQKQK